MRAVVDNEEVVTLSESRATLTQIVRSFREHPDSSTPVIIGAHRRPTAVIVPIEQYRNMSDGVRIEPGDVRSLLHERRDLIMRLAAMHNLDDVKVFGSVARGEADERSDVDLLVETGDGTSYFDIAGFASDVEAIVRRPVDILSVGSLDIASEGDRRILREARSL
ncbi:nucleotidyltransferase domain-containing protein [Paramicrobacterium fandaimingii]|uniref:nucleotidyltransferase domain-containing protein n=1 Tax=Paramicrobacterium fandaimingii TaxID=2708079 RepID=UPI00141EA758|nr:nucleotidyltransferase domain-containing protein [Microbacterium fandaimingii]